MARSFYLAFTTKKPAMNGLMKPKERGACRSFFVARCREARSSAAVGYEHAGYTLVMHIA
jgi:hypothetical protein